MRFRLLAVSALLVGLGAGCNTAVGNYFANRARDFGECFRVEVRDGESYGVGVRAGGVVEVGFYVRNNTWARWGGFGLNYGRPHAFGYGVVEPKGLSDGIGPGFGWHRAPQHIDTTSYLVPSALFAHGEDGKSIWKTESMGWERLHAFDVEVYAGFFPLDAVVGFSPGEFVDFVLGWFGLDIAGDDRELPKSERG